MLSVCVCVCVCVCVKERERERLTKKCHALDILNICAKYAD